MGRDRRDVGEGGLHPHARSCDPPAEQAQRAADAFTHVGWAPLAGIGAREHAQVLDDLDDPFGAFLADAQQGRGFAQHAVDVETLARRGEVRVGAGARRPSFIRHRTSRDIGVDEIGGAGRRG